jgi:hypothetical protein
LLLLLLLQKVKKAICLKIPTGLEPTAFRVRDTKYYRVDHKKRDWDPGAYFSKSEQYSNMILRYS